jgi:hypothetical protein
VILRFQPLFSYGHKGALSAVSRAEDIDTFFEAILHSSDPFSLMQAESQRNYPVFPKAERPTHIAFKETRYLNVVQNILASSPDVKVFGILRNPLATLGSWMNAPKEFEASWDISTEWRFAPSKNQGRPEEFFGFEKWKEAANNFLDFVERFPNRFHLIRYDELNAATESVIADVFQFAELSVCAQTMTFIHDSRNRHDEDPYSVFRMKVNDDQWRLILPEYIQNSIHDELKGTRLDVFIG